jgi:hypothetical protein
VTTVDSRSDIVALANARQISPSELVRLPIPAPGNGHTDSTIEAIRLALMAINHRHPGGDVLPVDALRERVGTLVGAASVSNQELTGRELPVLIRDLHTTMAAGRDVAELLDLAALLHTQATIAWLRIAGASTDLREQALVLACRAAEERDTPTARGLAAAGAVRVMLSTEAFDLAQAEFDSVTVPTNTPEMIDPQRPVRPRNGVESGTATPVGRRRSARITGWSLVVIATRLDLGPSRGLTSSY